MEETKTNETGLASEATDLVEEASALNEMSSKVKALEAQNAELMAAKKKYYDAILNGVTVEEVVQYRNRDEIRKDLFGKDKSEISNLEYAKLVVELDDACIRETGESCFLPKGKNVSITSDERETAQRVHDCLSDCIEEANNDSQIFNQALARRIKRK